VTSAFSPSPPGAIRPYFNEPERAALALSEAATRLSDRADPVPDEVWKEAARHYDERAQAALLVQIGLINVFNRLNAAKQVAGEWGQSTEKKELPEKSRSAA
jgi:alkylhydroperoxidase family enzyme